MKKLLNVLHYIESKINLLNPKFVAVLSIFFIFLGISAYILEKYLFFYFCGPDRYGVGFHCGSVYYRTSHVIEIILLSCSLFFSILILIKERQKYHKLVVFLTFFIFGTLLLTLLSWDDSSGFMGFNINFGPIILLIGFVFIAILISFFAWSHLIGRNHYLILPFIIFGILLIYSSSLIQLIIPNKTYLQKIDDCNSVLLQVGKDACIYSRAARKGDPLICKDIIDLGVKTQCSDYVYSNKAIYTRNPKLCELIISEGQKKICYEAGVRYWYGR